MFHALEIGDVYVTDPTLVEATFLTSSYNIYKVSTSALPDCIVERTYEDFKWLSDQLYFDHPGQIAPAIPEIYNVQFQDNRRRSLEQFLNRLVRHNVLKRSSKLETFLLGNLSSLTNLKERTNLVSPIIVGSTLFSQTLSYLTDTDAFDKLSTHAEIDFILAYVNRLDFHLDSLVGKITRLVDISCDQASSHYEVAQAFNALGEEEDPVVGGLLIEGVSAFTNLSSAMYVYAQSVSEDLEEPVREYSRLMFSIRRAVQAREDAWANYINSKGEVVRSRDNLRKSLMLSKIIGNEGREELVSTRTNAVETALADEKEAGQVLDNVSADLMLEFGRFMGEKQRDMSEILGMLLEIEVPYPISLEIHRIYLPFTQGIWLTGCLQSTEG
jgi:hypothetical protein